MSDTIATATRCSCGACVEVERHPFRAGWIAACHDCYDGTEDAGERAHVVGHGDSIQDALWDWQDKHDEAWEVEWTPRTELEELDKQIAQESLRQLGWVRDWVMRPGVDRGPKPLWRPAGEP